MKPKAAAPQLPVDRLRERTLNYMTAGFWGDTMRQLVAAAGGDVRLALKNIDNWSSSRLGNHGCGEPPSDEWGGLALNIEVYGTVKNSVGAKVYLGWESFTGSRKPDLIVTWREAFEYAVGVPQQLSLL